MFVKRAAVTAFLAAMAFAPAALGNGENTGDWGGGHMGGGWGGMLFGSLTMFVIVVAVVAVIVALARWLGGGGHQDHRGFPSR